MPKLALRVFSVILAALLCFTASSPADAAGEPGTIVLWPQGAPGEKAGIGEETQLPMKPGDTTIRIANVTKPTITICRPAPERDTGTAVLICPGGGYSILAWNKEGTEVADWLNTLGVTGVVLKYRVPARQGQEVHKAPLQDAQRALGFLRTHARDLRINPKQIGVLGFSAGGHLAALLSTQYGQRTYDKIDDADQASCRPDFTLLIYPAFLVAKQADVLSPELTVTADTPRAFLVHAQDDGVRVESSIFYYLALRNAKVPAEMHLYPTGGHGYGLRPSAHEVSHWPQRAEQWLRSINVLKLNGPVEK